MTLEEMLAAQEPMNREEALTAITGAIQDGRQAAELATRLARVMEHDAMAIGLDPKAELRLGVRLRQLVEVLDILSRSQLTAAAAVEQFNDATELKDQIG